MDAIAQHHDAQSLWRDLTARVAQLIGERRAHPARTVVLLPYAQLMPVARQSWARRFPDGFAPRFETTRNWAGTFAFEPGPQDLAFEMGRDLLTARALLARTGFEARADALAARVVEAAMQLAPLAAAVAPQQRPAWAVKARAALAQGMEDPVLQLEALVARIALEWVAACGFATDALLAPALWQSLDLLVILEGLQPDPLHRALARNAGDRAVTLALPGDAPRGAVALHAARDEPEEAERAAACVLRHVAAGRTPVALAATDRVLTRRVAALLHTAGVAIRDEQGWKLSTTRSAAHLMALLRACAWDAASDQVLDWLKHVPALPAGVVLGLERRVRRAGLRDWRSLGPQDCGDSQALHAALQRVHAWRESMRAPRALPDWLAALRELLADTGQWTRLQQDDAGAQVLQALRLQPGEEGELRALPQAGRRIALEQFRAWAEEVLEADSFRPPQRADAPVVILPFGQTLGRAFAAMVLPGCDELRLPASPEPPGAWTAAQRRALGLPSREAAEALQRKAWAQALQLPQVDVLWRGSDSHGEALLASPLVQQLLLQGAAAAADPRDTALVPARAVERAQPAGAGLPLAQLSASAYEDLRRCPYRFFALRLLGLKEAEEVDTEVDKRDFGTWVHAVLRAFHESLRDDGEPPAGRAALLDRLASQALAALRLEEGEFLPFEAGWPGVRDAYLAWLRGHEASGARFAEAESEQRAQLDSVTLVGRIDRIDTLPDGARLVIDYKTESGQATRDRMKDPAEDTQLAFYAALLDPGEVRAAYLHIGERGTVEATFHPDVPAARDLMRAAIGAELGRISLGAPLPALGEGRACEFCAARGLCRKDSWS